MAVTGAQGPVPAPVPAARRPLVRRPRLVDLLPHGDGPLPRLVLVCAPAGFGKTTLLTQWLRDWQADGAGPRTVAWVCLEAADDDPLRLVADLVTAVAVVLPPAAAEAQALLAAGGRAAPGAVVASLVAGLETALDGGTGTGTDGSAGTGPGSLVLALDDLHAVASAPALAVLADLVDTLPARAALAVTSRADPALPVARLRARGELAEVRASDLRFSTAEAAAFLVEVMGLALAPEQVGALQGRTEGWAAGLQLAGLSLRGRDDAAAFIERFTGSHRFVLDYLVEEVLDGLEERDRAFLLDTCVLDRLTGPLCDALTGGTDGRARLEALERANLFVVPLDDTRTAYRYHHLFADALRARLTAADPDRMRRLHRAAAGTLARQGFPESAVGHAVAGCAPALAARLVERALPEMTRRRQDLTLRHWLTLLADDEVRARPLLNTFAAWGRLGAGEVGDAEDRLVEAERTLGTLPADEVAADEELRRLPATIAMYRAAIAQARQDVEGTVRLARHILDLADDRDHLRRGAAFGFLGMARWADGDLPAALDTFTQCARSMRAAGNLTDELGCTVPLALMWWDRGRPDEARRLHERALGEARRHPAVALPVVGDLHVGLAACLVETADLDAAGEHLATARDLGETASLPENRHRWALAAARLRQAQGDLDEAAALLEQAEASYLPGFFPEVRPVAAMRARLDLARGRTDLARDWARRTGPAALGDTYLSECSRLTLVRLLLADADAAGARTLLGGLLAAAEGAGRDGSVVEILALQALAERASGRTDAAVERLVRALALGVPAGYRRLFLDEGPAMADLLAEVGRRGEVRDLVAGVLRGGADGGGHAGGTAGTDGTTQTARAVVEETLPPDRRLSDREVEVLRLLATELTGPEIAGRLFVSVNTLRTHTRHIFTKLDVTTRAAAVRRGRELRLL